MLIDLKRNEAKWRKIKAKWRKKWGKISTPYAYRMPVVHRLSVPIHNPLIVDLILMVIQRGGVD